MMKNKKIGIVFLALSELLGASAFCASPDDKGKIPEQGSNILRVGPTSVPPIIDGNLTDECWQDATIASGFISTVVRVISGVKYHFSFEGGWPRKQTSGYVTYDDTYLYIAFSCNEAVTEKIKAETTKNDEQNIWADDSVEIFLDINHDRTTYCQFIVNSIGARYEAYVKPDEGIRKKEWNPKLELKTKIGAQSWTTEMRIPFASLGTSCPQPGDVWGINLNRNCYTGDKPEHHSWAAMIQASFNDPEHFGKMVFGSSPDLSYSILAMDGNELRMKLRNGKESPLTLRTQLAVDESSQITTTYLRPKEEREIRIRYNEAITTKLDDIPLLHRNIELAIAMINAKTGEVYDSRKGGMEVEQPPPMELSIDRYYYSDSDDVQQVQVSCRRNSTKGHSVKVEARKEARGKPVATRQIAFELGKDDSSFSFDITDWDIGRYVVSAHLLGEGSEKLSSIHRVFIKKKHVPAKLPPPGAKISVRSDGTILLDEEPFCPFIPSTVIPQHCKDCFNVELGGWGGQAHFGTISRPMKRLNPGFPNWSRVDGKVVVVLPEEEKLYKSIRNNVSGVLKSNPLLLYWYLTYEAQIPIYRDGGQEDNMRLNNAEELRKISQFVKSIDPDHLTAIQIDHGDWAGYKDAADIIEVACYSSSYDERLIPQVIEDVHKVKDAIGQDKPLVFWIGSFIPYARTAEEIRGASYLALLHGATGLAFHMGHGGDKDPSLTRHWSIYPGLSREIEHLFAILKAPRSKPRIIVEPAGVIDFRVRKYNNRRYLIAVNTSDRLVNARISITDESVRMMPINILFENRQITPKGNSFVDLFTAFEPHVYEFPSVK